MLDPFEKASVISYALTASMPDDALLADAANNGLDAETIRLHTRRLFASEAGRQRWVAVIKQWLRVSELDVMAASPSSYPKLAGNNGLGTSLHREFERYVTSVVFEGEGTLQALLTSNQVDIDARTAPLYGLGVGLQLTAHAARLAASGTTLSGSVTSCR